MLTSLREVLQRKDGTIAKPLPLPCHSWAALPTLNRATRPLAPLAPLASFASLTLASLASPSRRCKRGSVKTGRLGRVTPGTIEIPCIDLDTYRVVCVEKERSTKQQREKVGMN